MTRIPTVNFTELTEISKNVYLDKGLEEPIQLFPRWVASATLNNRNTRRNTSAHMIAGDSMLERRINVAPEFPNKIFKRDELATTSDVLDILGVQVGD
jgi:hypothetical protein